MIPAIIILLLLLSSLASLLLGGRQLRQPRRAVGQVAGAGAAPDLTASFDVTNRQLELANTNKLCCYVYMCVYIYIYIYIDMSTYV